MYEAITNMVKNDNLTIKNIVCNDDSFGSGLFSNSYPERWGGVDRNRESETCGEFYLIKTEVVLLLPRELEARQQVARWV
jgi:hypothetical protein